MSEQKAIVTIGEAMIELTRGKDGRFSLTCGGDTFNTAVYLARAGLKASYATAIGDDPYSDALVALAAAEGIERDLILRVPQRLPGITLIDSGPARERLVYAWREGSPARELFELPEWSAVAEGLVSARLIYFSGITLSLFSNIGLGRFLATLEVARHKGVKVAFDGNFRPRGWHGDLNRTRAVFMEALRRVDIALPSFDDEAVLWGDRGPEATVERMRAFGVAEIVVKNGANSAIVAGAKDVQQIPVPEVMEPVDATAAGDGFNAGYLAARLTGDQPAAATEAAHRLAGHVIRHLGALTPRSGAAVH